MTINLTNSSKIKLLLLLVIALGAFLRFYHLGSNPPALDWDEVAHGYNAYSILKTGRDEFGYKFPLYFRSFDDYKPPVYTYLTVAPVAIFGLTDFAVRFPSALLGTFAILTTYLMVSILFKKKEIALISAFFLAISPWHIHFSRVAFEANSTVFFTTLGVWLFLLSLKYSNFIRSILLTLAAISFSLNLFTYHSARVFTPIIALTLLILYLSDLKQFKKLLILPVVVSIFTSLVLFSLLTSKEGQFRFQGTTIFQDKVYEQDSQSQEFQDSTRGQLLLGKILHNRRLSYVQPVILKYFSHFNPSFLFFTSDSNRHHAPDVGLLYIWDLPFLIGGLFLLISKDFNKKIKIIMIVWLLATPIAASVTWGEPVATRVKMFMPTFQILVAIGVYYFFKRFISNKWLIGLVLTALVINIFYFLHQYYVHLPIEYSQDWYFGRKEAAEYTESVKNRFDRVIVSTKLEQPHEFWLYYTKYNPDVYLKEGGTISGGFLEDRNKFDKYAFKPINLDEQKTTEKTLFVGVPENFPKNVKVDKKIYYLNGEEAIYIVDGTVN